MSAILQKARVQGHLRDTNARFGADRRGGLEWLQTELAQHRYIAANARNAAVVADTVERAAALETAIAEYEAETERLNAAEAVADTGEADQYKRGYLDRCHASRELEARVRAHYAGQPLDRPGDWFTGWNDAEDDCRWSNRGSHQMQFNQLPWRLYS